MFDEKKNSNFIMMYREHMPEIRWLTKKNGNAVNILNFIMEHMDNRNALMCSYEVFIDYFQLSETTVWRCIKLLYDNGFIDILKSGSANVYIVNQEIAWTSWDNQKKYCQFEGKILVSAKENKDYEYKSQSEKFKQLRIRENIKDKQVKVLGQDQDQGFVTGSSLRSSHKNQTRVEEMDGQLVWEEPTEEQEHG